MNVVRDLKVIELHDSRQDSFMTGTDNTRIEDPEIIQNGSQVKAGEYIAQIYVIHEDGMVLFSREYDDITLKVDPQLIGGFLTAINTFARTTTLNKCPCENDHHIEDIGMSCARWFVKSQGEFTISMLIMNDSPLITSRLWNIISNIGQRIIGAFEIVIMLSENENRREIFKVLYDEFGKSVDNIVFESISDTEKIDYTSGKQVKVTP